MLTTMAARRRAALAGLVLLAGCGRQENAYAPPPPPVVDVAVPVRRQVPRYLEATGYMATVNEVDLVARIQGFLQSIDYQDGAFVRQGTRLFTIEPEPYRLKLEQAKASEVGSQARLVQAEAEYRRQSDLASRQNAPMSLVDIALSKRDSERASLRQAQADVGLAAINQDYAYVSAPFDGIVSAHLVSVGELVGNGPTKLATIVQLDPIHVEFSLSEQDVLRVRAEMRRAGTPPLDLSKVSVEVGLQDESGFPHKGTLDYAAPTLDKSTGTLAVRGLLSNPDRVLLPGNFVRVRVPLGQPEEALLVPATAVGSDQAGKYVLVVDDHAVVAQRRVTLGPASDGLQVISEGVGPEDRVVVGGAMRAVPGGKVEPRTANAAVSSSASP
jgi:RND family efflux transporter MFP subunit